ncbi:hypothetical protein MPK67_gp084 [Erwinia phage pEa_SNUABM_32]|uniref:Uncharacterized protein n=1 Tax=Erwinia phage pEa_SNUABM_32 TaxID=2869555 RepID=A0AAE7XKG8_9CAUD|nr:hypothetical protein MPK67_gp084 [Erwinia phage pEa_SNUABM_32]QZE56620.1 hypothetical protein pEaSNUABM20_00084 [Erwinia phage pEa_SNUABM_20]QZE56957.1 hypothetical protein pEaSNUABM32_00084 [Erwinia phage pEa_SNUABM_32]UAW52865.1 hypothetical protein pEaSNUABM23_00083 [Erwinia phage pEa_SNUABM_23]UIW10761.1 hypothetical protein pEaSNUABM23_00083 [Erwinia phage pEa_SNUABM_31]
MELFPYQAANVASVFALGLLYDTDVPANGERGIHSTFNDAIAMRLFQKTFMSTAPFSWRYQPVTASTFLCTNFYPAWVEFSGSLGYGAAINVLSRIVPKVRLPALDNRFAATVGKYNESVATTILAHKMGTIQTQFSINTSLYLSPQYNLTEAGNWLIAEYDFGAEMELKGLVGVSIGSMVSSLMVLGTANTFLQAYVDGQWVDAVDCYTNVRTTTNWSPVAYNLPVSIKAQKWRLVNKTTAWPWSTTGHYPFSLQFYGNYTGTKPRTLGKYKHMSLLTLMANSSYANSTQWHFNWPAAEATVAGRYFGMTHLTVTDDLKLAASNDIVMPDTTYSIALGEAPVPTFRIKQDALVGRGV